MPKICTEPSPDVLSAIASNLDTDIAKKTFALNISESAAQISRIATTELIREWLYRSCEAFFNGAMIKEDYQNIQADFLMVSSSLLAIDRLGASINCGTQRLATAKATVDTKSQTTATLVLTTPSSTTNNCSHLTGDAMKGVATAIENIVKQVSGYSSRYNTTVAGQCLIKGNINSEKDRIYHLPGQSSYEETEIDNRKGERFFCSEDEAQENGFRPHCENEKTYIAFITKKGGQYYYADINDMTINKKNKSIKVKNTSHEYTNRKWYCETDKNKMTVDGYTTQIR